MNIKEKSGQDFSIFTKFLLVIYLVALTWAILFKFKLDIHVLGRGRSLILKPFFINEGHINKSDFYSNVAAFVPFGIYLSALKSKGNLFARVMIPVIIMSAVSLFYETAQYIFKIGCSDINDLISNTLGGIIGVIIYYILYLIFRKHTNTAVNILAGMSTAAAMGFLVVSVLNGSCEGFQNKLMAIFNF